MKSPTMLLFFLVNGVNANIQVPVAFHFITTLNARDRMSILLELLAELFKQCVIISNITFDGLAANKAMCELLGASFKRDDMRTFFIDPYSKRKVFIILDPSHCIKLVRNHFCYRKVFVDSAYENIEWRFIKALVEYGKKNDFGLTHKLTNRHINFQNKKMHVRTAVQTMSNSSANSLEFLMKQNIHGFRGANATIKFLRMFNTIFDIMNTQRVDHNQTNHFKSAINFFNFEEVFNFLHEAKDYIYQLQVRSRKSGRIVPVVKSLLKTGFVGFIINIESLMAMYSELVQEKEFMHMIATYTLSQDHVEMFFSKIRSIHRTNDNPTVQQYKASYKRIQMTSDILISQHANISSVTPTVSNLLTISTSQISDINDKGSVDKSCDNDQCVEQIEGNETYTEHDADISQNASISFVASEVEKRLLMAGGCSYCKKVIRENDKLAQHNCVGMNIPCQSTFEICMAADVAIKQLMKDTNNNFKHKIKNYVMQKIDFNDLYPNYFELHHDEDHKHYLVNYIINEYTHIKCTFISKQRNLEMHKIYFRNKNRKDVQRAGQ